MISISLQQKGFYPCEYMDDWEKFNKTSLPEIEDFHSRLNMNEFYTHTKGVCKDFKMQNLGEYHDLHVQSDTLLLPDVFENF